MKNFVSTRNDKNIIDGDGAIIKGLAKDGGLYLPETIEAIDLNSLKDLNYLDLASAILSHFFDNEEVSANVSKAYTNSFDSEEITPLTKVGNDYFIELFHGPTCAFKDVALTLLPHLLTSAYKKKAIEKNIVILTATSGDTGKAALEGFKDVENVFIKVLYPYKLVSSTQERQMVTTEGKNTEVLAVRGNFDDCQKTVKKIMEEEKFYEHLQLSSANSINIGRLIPQIVYYFKSYFDLLRNEEITEGELVDFIVPTGNFGDILAGYFAKRMGLPVGKLVCASNVNNVLTDFLNTGVYNKNRPLIKTISPSIDILVSSNLERLLYLESNDSAKVKEYMEALNKDGIYSVDEKLLQNIQNHFVGYSATEQEVMDTIKEYYNDYNYLIDTHTSVAVSCMKKYQKEHEHNKCIVLSTASPFKFSKDVYYAITGQEIADDLSCPDKLSALTGKEVPPSLAALAYKPIRFTEVVDKDAINSVLLEKLQEINHD